MPFVGTLDEVLDANTADLLKLAQQGQRVVRGNKDHRGTRLQLRKGTNDGTMTDSVRNSAHIELRQLGVAFTAAAVMGLGKRDLLVVSLQSSFLMIASPKIAHPGSKCGITGYSAQRAPGHAVSRMP